LIRPTGLLTIGCSHQSQRSSRTRFVLVGRDLLKMFGCLSGGSGGNGDPLGWLNTTRRAPQTACAVPWCSYSFVDGTARRTSSRWRRWPSCEQRRSGKAKRLDQPSQHRVNRRDSCVYLHQYQRLIWRVAGPISSPLAQTGQSALTQSGVEFGAGEGPGI